MKRILTHTGAAVGGAVALVLTVGVVAFASSDKHRSGHHAERIDHIFEMLDANADGAIELAEIEEGHKARFSAADTNADGTLSPEEMKAAATKRVEQRVERMVQRLDANSDGVLDQAEFAKGGHKHKGKFATKMFERFDADGDGRVTREEADAHMAARHKKHDG